MWLDCRSIAVEFSIGVEVKPVFECLLPENSTPSSHCCFIVLIPVKVFYP
jgi:hypothetical protein